MSPSNRRPKPRPADLPGPQNRSRRPLVLAPVAVLATLGLMLGTPGAASADDHDGGLLGQVGEVVDQSVQPVTGTLRTATTPRTGASGGSSSSAPSSSSGESSSHTVERVGRAVDRTVHKVARTPLVRRPSSGAPSTSRPSSSSGSHRGSSGSVPRTHRTAPARTATSGSQTTRASGEVGNVDLVRRDVLDLSRSRSIGTTSAAGSSATLVGLAGRPLIGSSASTTSGGARGYSPVPGNPLCRVSMGTLCLDVLYADSAAAAGGGSSSSSSRTGVTDACVLGDDASGSACSGVRLGVDRSQSQQSTGTAGSTSSGASSLADLCVPGATAADCAVSLEAVGSSSSAGTGATPRTQPTLFDLGLLGARLVLPRQPIGVEAPKDCTDPSLVCGTLNQVRPDGEAAADAGVLGDAVNAVLGDSSSTSTSPTPASGGTGSGAPAAGPDLATATLADLDLTGVSLAELSDNRSTGTSDGTQGDATLVSVLGHELFGAHADSAGTTHDGGSLLELPACSATNGLVCASLLYADASATRTDTTRDASTHTGIADTCLLGSDATGAGCDGLSVGVAQGASSLHSESATGAGQASSSSSLVDTCLHADGGCLLSGEVLGSRASSDTEGRTASNGSLSDVTLDGTTVGLPASPITITAPMGSAPQVVAAMLNANDTALGRGAASVGQTVVGADVADGLAQGSLASTRASTSTANEVRPPAVVDPPTTGTAGAAGTTGTTGTTVTTGTASGTTSGTGATGGTSAGSTHSGVATAKASTGRTARAEASDGVLPHTGGPAMALLSWGLLLLAMGGVLVAARRRSTDLG